MDLQAADQRARPAPDGDEPSMPSSQPSASTVVLIAHPADRPTSRRLAHVHKPTLSSENGREREREKQMFNEHDELALRNGHRRSTEGWSG